MYIKYILQVWGSEEWAKTEKTDYPVLAAENITPDLTKKRVERKFLCWNFGTLVSLISFYYRWSSITTTPPCSAEFCSSKINSSGLFYPSSSMLSPQQLHLDSLMRSTGEVAGDISSMSFQRRNSPALQLTTSSTDSAHCLSDTTALSRNTITLPKWKQQLLSLPSVLSSCVSSTARYSAVVPLKWPSCTNCETTEKQTPLTSHFWKHGLLLLTSQLWAFVSCSVWYCFSRCHSFFLPEMYKLIFHVLGSFSLLGMYL